MTKFDPDKLREQLAKIAKKNENDAYIVRNSELPNNENWRQAVKKRANDSTVKAKRKAAMPDQSGENNPFYGKTHSEESISKILDNRRTYDGQNNPFYGKKHDKIAIAKMRKPRSEAAKQNMRGPREQKTCPYCGAVGAGGNMTRYHFDNCKEKK